MRLSARRLRQAGVVIVVAAHSRAQEVRKQLALVRVGQATT